MRLQIFPRFAVPTQFLPIYSSQFIKLNLSRNRGRISIGNKLKCHLRSCSFFAFLRFWNLPLLSKAVTSLILPPPASRRDIIFERSKRLHFAAPSSSGLSVVQTILFSKQIKNVTARRCVHFEGQRANLFSHFLKSATASGKGKWQHFCFLFVGKFFFFSLYTKDFCVSSFFIVFQISVPTFQL